jgi:transposase
MGLKILYIAFVAANLPITGVEGHHRKKDARSVWLQQLRARRGPQVAAVALANKNTRILWALLATGEVNRQAA